MVTNNLSPYAAGEGDKLWGCGVGEKLYSELLEDLGHFLLGLDVGGHEGQTETVLDEAHVVEQGLHAGRVAVDEEEAVELCEHVMDLAGWVVLAVKLQSDHTRELLGQGVANDRDDAGCSAGHHREGEGVVAADDVEVVGFVLDNLVYLFEASRSLFDTHDVGAVFGQSDCGGGLHVHACSSGYVIKHDG